MASSPCLVAEVTRDMLTALLRIGDKRVACTDVGANPYTLKALADRGFLSADRDGKPILYELSDMGRGAVAVLNAPIVIKDNEQAIARIQRTVAQYYGIPLSEMTSDRRSRVVARPRQIAMYLCRMLTPHSLPRIGTYFGGRDHTTVMHAIKTIEGLCEINHRGIATQVDELFRMLEPEALAA